MSKARTPKNTDTTTDVDTERNAPTDPAPPPVATRARALLGQFLIAEAGRSWTHGIAPDGKHQVTIRLEEDEAGAVERGIADTEDEAILAALGLARARCAEWGAPTGEGLLFDVVGEEPAALYRRMRKAHVETVLQFVREELPGFMRKNPSYDLKASVPALQRQYESEHSELMRAEEAIADAGARDA